MERQASFNYGLTLCGCTELSHTVHAHSAVPQLSASAVVLMVVGCVPHFYAESFFRTLFLAAVSTVTECSTKNNSQVCWGWSVLKCFAVPRDVKQDIIDLLGTFKGIRKSFNQKKMAYALMSNNSRGLWCEVWHACY